MKKVIILLSISLLLSTSLYSKNRKYSKMGIVTKGAVAVSVLYFLNKHKIIQIPEFPILKEAIQSLITKKSYQVRYCIDDKGEHKSIPNNFKSCPFKDTTIYYEQEIMK